MDFSELAPVVTAWRGSRAQDLPIEFGGRAKFQGTVLGRLARPALAGHLELHDFTTLLRRQEKPVAGAAPAERVVRTRWELLEGDVEYSATHESLRNGVLRRGGARIGLDASVALANGSYDASQPFSAHVKVENAEAGELQGLVGSNYPVSGQVSGDVHVEGTESHLSGSGRIAMKDGSAWRQAVRSATAEVNFTENQAQLRNIVVRSDVMQLSGDARINVQTSEFGFDLKGTEVKIENLRAVREGKIRATGQATFEASGEGTPAAPVINGRLRLRNLAVNRQAIGDMNVDAVTHGSEMTLTARSNFKAGRGEAGRADSSARADADAHYGRCAERQSEPAARSLSAAAAQRPIRAEDAHRSVRRGAASQGHDCRRGGGALGDELWRHRRDQRWTDPPEDGERSGADRAVPHRRRAGHALSAGARRDAVGRQAGDRPARRRQPEPEAAGDHRSESDGRAELRT